MQRGRPLSVLTLALAEAEWTRICENNERRQQGLPEKTQRELADELTKALGTADKPVTEDQIRKAWKRAGAGVFSIAVTQRLYARQDPSPPDEALERRAEEVSARSP